MKKSFFILLLFCLAVEARPPSVTDYPTLTTKERISLYLTLERQELSTQPVTIERINRAFEIEGIKGSEFVIAQIRLETGNLTSELCLQNNNLCGMKLAKVRKTTATGQSEHGYAIYQNWYDCIVDIGLWQQYYISKGRDLSNYPAFIASVGYASDTFYLAKVEQIRKNISKN